MNSGALKDPKGIRISSLSPRSSPLEVPLPFFLLLLAEEVTPQESCPSTVQAIPAYSSYLRVSLCSGHPKSRSRQCGLKLQQHCHTDLGFQPARWSSFLLILLLASNFLFLCVTCRRKGKGLYFLSSMARKEYFDCHYGLLCASKQGQ